MPWILISPAGERVEVLNTATFARKHGLNRANVWKVLNGERQHTGGWISAFPPTGFTSKPYAIERYKHECKE